MHWWYMNGWWGGWLMMIFMLIFWVLIIVGVALLVRWLWVRTSEGQPGAGESAMEILRRRYARSEITREQYQEMRRDLEQTGRSQA